MNRTLIIYPTHDILNKYSENESIVFLNSTFLTDFEQWKIDFTLKDTSLNIYSVIKDSNVSSIIDQIKEYSPIWSRWSDRGDQIELYYRYALEQVYHLSIFIQMNDVDVAIFPTGAPHHIDTALLQIACSINLTPQVYLYSVVGGLLPLIQRKNITDREPLSCEVSNNKHADNYKNLFSVIRSIKNSNAFSKSYSSSLYISIFFVLLTPLRAILSRIKQNILSNYISSNSHYKDYSVSTHISQLLSQHKSLKYYKENISNSANIKKNEVQLLIAAHYQPEATSYPEGWRLHNHVDIVYELRSKGYTAPILYKEHPATFMYTADVVGPTRVAQARSKKYYEQLMELGCIFLDTDFELSLDLNENVWYIPVTITGSIAIERSLNGFKTIVTGYPWYKGLPGTIHISEIKSLTTINKEMTAHDSSIATKAFKYLENILDNKTLLNGLGIGTGKKLNDVKLQKLFRSEYDNLIEYLLNTKLNNSQ
jgi:hypothetical protein